MSDSRHALQSELPLYLSQQVVGSATVTGSALDFTGFNQATLEIDLADGTGTAALTFYLEVTNDLSGTPTYRRVQSVSWSSGTGTLVDATWSHATGGAAAKLCVNVPLNYKAGRFVFACADGGATDLLDVRVRLGVV